MGSIVEEASLNVPGNKMLIDKLPECMADSCKFAVTCLVSELKKTLNDVEGGDKELKIGKIFGLSDTIFCLLTIKSSTVGRWAGSMTAHLASLLIENRVINALSSALQFIDSNNPAYEEVTVNIVRTLEALCKYSNKFAKLAAKKSGNTSSGLGGVTDFSRLLQDFSSDDSGFSDDYGFESEGSDDEEDEDGMDEMSGIETDTDMDTDDSEMISESESNLDSDLDSDDENSDSDMTTDSDDYDSDEDIIEIVPEIDMESASGDLSLSSVRGRNTRIGTSGPYELIVEEIDEEDSDDDMGGARGFPVGMDDDSDHMRDDDDDDEDGREYDFDHHHRHHHLHHGEDDFDSDEHDHIDHSDEDEDDEEDDMMMEGMGMGDDDDWNDQGGHGLVGPDGNIMDFMEFPGGHMRISRHHHRGSGGGRHRNELNALLHGLNSGSGSAGIPMGASSYSGQVRLGADSGVHPLMSRPVLDPLADPLRAHLPLTQPVQTSRPMSVVFGRSGTIEMTSGPVQQPSTPLSRVNAEPFHFPQAVATNRRWQQDVRFTFSDLTRLICSALKSDLETILNSGSEELRSALKSIEAEEVRVLEIIQKATEEQEKAESDSSDIKKIFSDAMAGISAKTINNKTKESSSSAPASEETVEYVDMGMDAEFFQAVPIDLYEEVIQQHLVERRNNIPIGCNKVTISPDFLARIPQIARDMYVRMSDEEVRAYRLFNGGSGRSTRTNSPIESNSSSVPRTFESLISSAITSSRTNTPETPDVDRLRNLVAEVNDFLMAPSVNSAGMIANAAEPVPKVNLKELALSSIQSIPVVDPSSLVAMLRSYYSPVISERRLHHKLFQSLVANPRTRIELINLLIYVLERMPADMVSLGMVLDGYVENLSGNGSNNEVGSGAKGVKRSRSGSNLSSSTSLPGTPPPHTAPLRPQTPLVTDAHSKTHIPVLQRTLQLLLHLCSHDEDVCAFFTTPVEKPWTIKRHDRSALHNKKAHLMGSSSGNVNSPVNGPATMTITTKFPLVLVIACLERAAFAESSLLIEYLLHLLDTVTSPLSKVINPQDLKSKKTFCKIVYFYIFYFS